MRQFDYYESPLEKHLMWLGFQSTLGISAARTVYALTNPASTFRYVFADLAILLTYNFGYALMPVIVAD